MTLDTGSEYTFVYNKKAALALHRRPVARRESIMTANGTADVEGVRDGKLQIGAWAPAHVTLFTCTGGCPPSCSDGDCGGILGMDVLRRLDSIQISMKGGWVALRERGADTSTRRVVEGRDEAAHLLRAAPRPRRLRR